MVRIVIVDDHFFVRMGLASSLGGEEDFAIVGDAGSVAEAIDLYREEKPDVMLLDGVLADGHGHEVIKALKEDFPGVKIVMLSVEESEEMVHRAIEMGAMSYLTKSTPRKEIIHSVREVSKGRVYLPENVKKIMERREGREKLTVREHEVLVQVVRGLPNKLIADELGIAESTVKVHLGRIFEKFQVQDRTSAATVALARGVVILDSPN